MLLGIKLSNLSRDQKKLKAQKNFFNQFCRVPKLQHSAKETLPRARPAHSATAKETLPSACWSHSATCLLCRVPEGGTRQRLNAISPPDGRRTAGARAGHVHGLCRVPLGQHSAKETLCRVPCFADGRHSVKPGHAVCQFFAECPWPGTRQTTSLPSARSLALGKGRDTRQIRVFGSEPSNQGHYF